MDAGKGGRGAHPISTSNTGQPSLGAISRPTGRALGVIARSGALCGTELCHSAVCTPTTTHLATAPQRA